MGGHTRGLLPLRGNTRGTPSLSLLSLSLLSLLVTITVVMAVLYHYPSLSSGYRALYLPHLQQGSIIPAHSMCTVTPHMYLQLTLYRGYNTRPFYMYIRITHSSILSQLFSTRGIIPVHSLCIFALHMYPYFPSLLSTGGDNTRTFCTYIHTPNMHSCFYSLIPVHSTCTFTLHTYSYFHSCSPHGV
jgi:hypothetical protein